MERDIRRDRGQWRGCHTFNNIIIDDELSARDKKRNGALKMGHTYYYFYEVDGTHEMHNSTQPATTQCPYLPGQTVNTLEVPYEVAERKRSASLGSLYYGEYRTMNPEDKFVTPRPPPPIPSIPHQRLGSAPAAPPQRALSRSDLSSPHPTWRRRIFSRKSSTSRNTDRGRQADEDERPISPNSSQLSDDYRSDSSCDGSRTRDLSPESLRRFLSDDDPSAKGNEDRHTLLIPDEIVEENEDDENFASSALLEITSYTTSLAPPPFKRSHSDGSMPTISNVRALLREKYSPLPPLPVREPEEVPPASRFSFSSDSSVASSIEPISPEDETPFYDSNEEDRFSNESDANYVQPLALRGSRKLSLEQNYSLPRAPGIKNHPGVTAAAVSAPIDHQLDDLVSEMGWMVDIIRGKGI